MAINTDLNHLTQYTQQCKMDRSANVSTCTSRCHVPRHACIASLQQERARERHGGHGIQRCWDEHGRRRGFHGG